MTKNQIIEQLYLSDDFNSAINKMNPDHLRGDLKSEIALILLELDEPRIQQLYKDGGLKFFTVRIILNQIMSKTSPFYKKYRIYYAELNESMV